MLAVIPARGGSRGLPGKHLRLLGGTPLLAYTIRAAKAARRVDHVLVTTDAPEIGALPCGSARMRRSCVPQTSAVTQSRRHR